MPTKPLPLQPPRPFPLYHPVRLVLVGGFLGAGKTTALAALARALTERGRRVGIITNDQDAHLVDTATLQQEGLTVAEVAGGCFCCRFTDLLDAAQTVITRSELDILLCEPVGSCTDMAATVIAPLRHFYAAQLPIAPFSVLVDPRRVQELALNEAPAPFATEAAYIFARQLEEADEIVLNKTDRLDAKEAERLAEALAEKFGKPVRPISALRGDGIAGWADHLLAQTAGEDRMLREIDYDIYAAGEAVLGWLNATAEVTTAGKEAFTPSALLQEIIASVVAACTMGGAEVPGEVAHLKLSLQDSNRDRFLRANLTTLRESPALGGDLSWQTAARATLTINARVQSDPARLESVVRGALQQAADRLGVQVQLHFLQCFSPSYPLPPYRVPASRGDLKAGS